MPLDESIENQSYFKMKFWDKIKITAADTHCLNDLYVILLRKFGLSKNPAMPLNRKNCPPCNFNKLKNEYNHSPLSNEPDTFILLRIIGNDLPPRHFKGQSRTNLRFILEHETELKHCKKRFVVNRIVNPEEENKIIALLDDAKAPYAHIPFDRDEYVKLAWDDEGIPETYRSCTSGYKKLLSSEKLLIQMRRYRHKINYVMNNNGARNRALELGKSQAKWVLPWDGNCFLSEDGWDQIVSAVTSIPETPYVIVPMARIHDNRTLLDPHFTPDPSDEPQVIFRKDSTLRFNESYFYGRRPKVELLWRLGVPGIWNQWEKYPWDLPIPDYTADAGAHQKAGWVARLSSGMNQLDTNPVKRTRTRNRAIKHLIDNLDKQFT